MKILFVASGNTKTGEVVPFIKAQGESLKSAGVEVDYFPVVGHGLSGYWQSARRLRRRLRDHPVDLIHAHYTLSGWVAVLARSGLPIVLSLMGTDAYGEYIGYRKVVPASRYLTVLTWLIQPFVDAVVSKSANIERYVYRKGISHIIPNGVILDQFRYHSNGCRSDLGLAEDKHYVLFMGDRENKRKNYELARAAVDRLGRSDVELINPYPVPHREVAKYMSAADVFVLCSFMEGSPNVVKEAMACDCPCVVTDVGDAAWVVGDTPGCHVAPFDAAGFSRRLEEALAFAATQGRTPGRRRLVDLGLESSAVAGRLVELYRRVLRT